MVRLKKQKKGSDRNLFYLTLILTALGLVLVADASSYQALNLFSDRFYFLKQQAVWAGFGFLGLIFVSRIHYSVWQRVATPLLLFSLLFLLLVSIPAVGFKALGARRWLTLGSISFQPSEFAKFGLAVYLAKASAKKKGSLSFFLPIAALAFLIMLQPDLGTTFVLVTIGMVQAFVAGSPILQMLSACILGIVAGAVAIIFSPYRRDRLLTYLARTSDPLGRDYHVRQILLALGSGGLLGVGLGQSKQKYLFLPEVGTDSIFAVIAEETGFVGALVVLILFFLFIYSAIKIAKRAPDDFSFVLSCGIIAWIGGQAFVNFASLVSLIPLTGVPLPFLSYGGSSLVMVLLASGILLNISKYGSRR